MRSVSRRGIKIFIMFFYSFANFINGQAIRSKTVFDRFPDPETIFFYDMTGSMIKYAKGIIIGTTADNPKGLFFNYYFK